MAPLPPPSGKAGEPSWGENCRATLASRGAVYKRPGGGSQYSRSWSLHLVDMKIAVSVAAFSCAPTGSLSLSLRPCSIQAAAGARA